jgi:hypothetical protein
MLGNALSALMMTGLVVGLATVQFAVNGALAAWLPFKIIAQIEVV